MNLFSSTTPSILNKCHIFKDVVEMSKEFKGKWNIFPWNAAQIKYKVA